MISQLREVEHQFDTELVIIGVHAGKFHAERETKNIRQAVLRLGIQHPVVNDRQFRIWRSYGVNAWPTLAFIDPRGHYIGAQAGELPAEDLIRVSHNIIEDFARESKINRTPIPLRPEQEIEPERPLAFPGKILATDKNRLFVSDSNHNRILSIHLDETGNEGAIEAIAGQGSAGFSDGPLQSATFRHPQGLTLIEDMLYVADTGNHAVRQIDWTQGTVNTVAGTGKQGHYRTQNGPGINTPLNSPWDVEAHAGNLYIAMAGSHQLWRYSTGNSQIQLYAGTGGEALEDGPLAEALLAQPSGLTTDGQRLYFADSEASAIRWAEYEEQGKIGTLTGTGLFDFGDIDGTGNSVRLQHPLDVAWHENRIYIADTYNNKIKVLDPDSKSVQTFAGTGKAGDRDGDSAMFYEPGGLSVSGNRLYVADTNNHKIRVVDLETRRVSTLSLQGL